MTKAKRLRHFVDITRGTHFRPACDSPDRDHLEGPDTFKNTGEKNGARCPKCVEAYEAFLVHIRTCQVCHKEFESNQAMGNHHEEHVLRMASHSDEPLAFTLSVQGCYDETSKKARMLALAQKELRDYFPGKQFSVMPSRMMLRKDGENGVLYGEAHVAAYIFAEI